MSKLKYFLLFLIVVSFISCSKKVIPTTTNVEYKKKSTESELEYQYTFTEANKQLLFSNIKQAALLFSKCIELDSTRSMPYYQMANIYYRAGDATNALKYAKNAYTYDKTNIWINRLLIELYRVNSDFENAIEVAEYTIQQNQESIEFQFSLASIYHEAGKAKKALEILNSIENKFGVSEQVSISKHQIYAELNKEREAEEVLINLIDLNPNEYRFQGMLAEFYSTVGKNDEAESIYENLIQSNSNNPFIILSAAEHYRNVKKYDKSKDLYSKALLDEAFDLNNKIRSLIGIMSNADFNPNYKEFTSNLIDSLINLEGDEVKLLTLRADFNIRTNNYEKAEKDLAKVIEMDSQNFVFWEQFLFINNRQNDNETLLEYSERALKYFPNQPNLYLFKGLAEMNLNKYDKSVTSFKNGLKLLQESDPLELQFLTFLGDVYRNLGNNKKSDEYFEMVLTKDPNNLIVLNNYSYYLSLREEKLDIAEHYSRKTVEKEPQNSTYLDTYAWVLFKLSRYTDARKYIEKAIANSGSSNSEILDHYGEILAKLKEYDNAIKYWKLAIENGGEVKSIQEKIDNVLQLVNE